MQSGKALMHIGGNVSWKLNGKNSFLRTLEYGNTCLTTDDAGDDSSTNRQQFQFTTTPGTISACKASFAGGGMGGLKLPLLPTILVTFIRKFIGFVPLSYFYLVSLCLSKEPFSKQNSE